MHAVCTRRSPQYSRTRAILQLWLQRDGLRGWPSSTATTCAPLIPTYGVLPRTYDVLPLSVYSHLQSSEAIEARRKAEQAKLDELRAKVCLNLNRILVPLFPSIRTLATKSSYRCFRVFVPLLRNTRTVVFSLRVKMGGECGVPEYSYPYFQYGYS